MLVRRYFKSETNPCLCNFHIPHVGDDSETKRIELLSHVNSVMRICVSEVGGHL